MSAEDVVRFTQRHVESLHPTPRERVSVRSGMDSAVHLCDALAEEILADNLDRRGNAQPTKRGQELAAIAKLCGDAIWAMRATITIPDDDGIPPPAKEPPLARPN